MMELLHTVWNNVIVVLLVLTTVVFVHELGHYLVARWAGVKIDVFSIGFGPELFGWTTRSGTRWRISLIPLGGYVKMFGDADPSSTPDLKTPYTDAEKAVAFHFKPVGWRAAVVFAGPAANFIFAYVVLVLLLIFVGGQWTVPLVGQVQADSAAAQAGVQIGDRIVEANGQSVGRFEDLVRVVQMSVGEPISLAVLRDGKRINLLTHPQIKEMTDFFGNVQKVPFLGISSDPEARQTVVYGPISALPAAAHQLGEMVDTMFVGVGQIIVGSRSANDLRGPITMARGVGKAAELGLASVASFAVLLSVNLGIINLFPLPILDGGRLLFYGAEVVLRRPLGLRVQEYGFRIGVLLVFALMLFATRNDLADLRVWEYLKAIIS